MSSPLLDDAVKKMNLIRIVAMVVVFVLRINPWVKIALILSMDALKCQLLYMLDSSKLSKEKGALSQNHYYQYYDKIMDTLGYYMSYVIIKQHSLLTPVQTQILLGALIYRTVGVVIYLVTKKDNILLYFVDMFIPLLALFIVFGRCKLVSQVVIAGLFLAYKILIEQKLHYTFEGGLANKSIRYSSIAALALLVVGWIFRKPLSKII
jgi:hypothetical protein